MADVLRLSRTFDAPRDRIYSAWTQPERFAAWFGGEHGTVPLDELLIDAREGGDWRAQVLLPDGGRIAWAGEFSEVMPPERLSLTMTEHPASPVLARLTVELAETAGITVMTVTQELLDCTLDQADRMKAGFNDYFDSLQRVVTRE